MVLLILTFLIGSRVNEATRWIEIPGTGFRLQTSDVAKVALVVYLASVLSRFQNELKDFMLVSKYMMFPVAVICALIMPENLSTALMIFGICILIMFIGRVPFRFLLAYIGIGVAGVLLFAVLLTLISKDNRVEVWKNRIENHFSGNVDADDAYQSNQAKIAISTGGLFGKAPGKSTQRNMLPQSNSIHFCHYYREYGLLFAIPLILAYMILLSRNCKFQGILLFDKLIVMITMQAMLLCW